MKTNPVSILKTLAAYPALFAILFSSALFGAANQKEEILFTVQLDPEQKVTVTDKGEILVDHIRFRAMVTDRNSKPHPLNSATFKRADLNRKDKTTGMRAEIKLPGGVTGTFLQSTRETPGGGLDYKANLKFSPAATVKDVMLVPMSFSVARFADATLMVDGEPFVLPEEKPASKSEMQLFAGKVKSLEIPLHAGETLVIRGDFELRLLDLRPNGHQHYSVRIGFPLPSGKVSEASLNLSFEVR